MTATDKNVIEVHGVNATASILQRIAYGHL